MKDLINRLPLLRSLQGRVASLFKAPFKSFPGSEEYWKRRYKSGRSSGAGSYSKFAEFKAEVLNRFVAENNIQSVIEYGCGDGNQLRYAQYPAYIGYDVSPEAVAQCQRRFAGDETKHFMLIDHYRNQTAELTLSLDVIYHLIEDDIYTGYMQRLFASASKFAIIYATNTDQQAGRQAAHVKHRKFSVWIETNATDWNLNQFIQNPFSREGDPQSDFFADFYIYEKRSA